MKKGNELEELLNDYLLFELPPRNREELHGLQRALQPYQFRYILRKIHGQDHPLIQVTITLKYYYFCYSIIVYQFGNKLGNRSLRRL